MAFGYKGAHRGGYKPRHSGSQRKVGRPRHGGSPRARFAGGSSIGQALGIRGLAKGKFFF